MQSQLHNSKDESFANASLRHINITDIFTFITYAESGEKLDTATLEKLVAWKLRDKIIHM